MLTAYILQGARRNRKECKKLAILAESIAYAVLDAADGMQEEELGEKTLLRIILFGNPGYTLEPLC